MKVNPLFSIVCLFILSFSISQNVQASKIICKPNMNLNCDWDAGITKFNFSSNWMTALGNVPSNMLPTISGPYSTNALQFRDVGSVNSCNIGSFTRHFRINGEPNVTCSMSITFSGSTHTPLLEWPIDVHMWSKSTLTESDVLENTVRARRADSNGGCGITGTNLINDIATNNPITNNGFTPNHGPLEPGLRDQPRYYNRYKNEGCNVFGRKIVITQYTATDACKKWIVSFQHVNWCNNTRSCRETVYKYKGTDTPLITKCDAPKVKFLNDECLGETELKPIATSSSGTSSDLSWRVRIYLNNPNFTFNTAASREYNTVGGIGGNSAITGGSPTIYLSGTRALPPGTHGLKYIVSSACGTVTECDTSIVVWPAVPTPVCISLASAVMKNGRVEISAKHFDFKSFGYCGAKYLMFTFNQERPVNSLVKSMHFFKGNGILATQEEFDNGTAQQWIPAITVRERPTMPNGQPDHRGPDTTLIGGNANMVIGCKVGNGASFPEATIKMSVWDDRWFTDFCVIKVSLVDNQGGCAPPPPPPPPPPTMVDSLVTLGGNLYYEKGAIVADAKVRLMSSQPEYPIIATSDTLGGFLFEKLPINFEYKLTASKKGDFLEGVNVSDMVEILNHILEIKLITSPCKLEAADINGDGIIEVDDVTLLMQIILGTNDGSDLESWRFLDKKQVLADTIWPINKYIQHDPLMKTILDNELIAIKVGDLNGSTDREEYVVDERSSNINLITEDIKIKKGEIFEIPIQIENEITFSGIQAVFNFKNLEFIDLSSNLLNKMPINVFAKENEIRLVVASTNDMVLPSKNAVVTLKFKAKENGFLSDLLSLANNSFQSIMINSDDLRERNLGLKFLNGSAEITNLSNSPNPWVEQTAIEFISNKKVDDAKISIYDSEGKLVYSTTNAFAKGKNIISINQNDLKSINGLFIYQIIAGNDVYNGKMLKIK